MKLMIQEIVKEYEEQLNFANSELIELRAYKKAAEIQVPFAWANNQGETTINEIQVEYWRRGGYEITPLYAKPVPADKPAVAVPDGWKLVPDIHTPEMEKAFHKGVGLEGNFLDGYEYMLATAPSHSQQSAPTDSGVAELDSLCDQYNRKEIDIVGLTSRIWNVAYWEGQKFGGKLSGRCPSHESDQQNKNTEGK